MPWAGREMPHVVIEVNQTCNISCTACYKDKSSYTKPVALVQQEIDLALAQRNLRMMTLAGGETSLHPDLPAIIRYAARQGVRVQMLSNGYALDDERLTTYRDAGLDGILVHVDSLQKRPDAPPRATERQLDELRRTIMRRITRHGLHCYLACTLYQENLAQLPDLVDFVLETPECSRLLVTCFTDGAGVARRLTGGTILGAPARDVAPRLLAGDRPAHDPSAARQVVTNAEVKRLLRAQRDMQPFGYVASNLRATEERWIFYYAFVIDLPDGGRRVLHLPASFGRVVDASYALARFRGQPYSFGDIPGPARSVAICLLAALASLAPDMALRTASFLAQLRRPGARIRHKSFNFQEGPTVSPAGELEYCKDCPDATVRDGVLVPVCMVDYLRPLSA
jgi:hypothetical protein